MDVREGGIPGLKIIQPKVFGDHRGFFLETFSEERYAKAGIQTRFVQDNISHSQKGILRGLHFQFPHSQGKLITVLVGEVYDVVVDVRVGSPSFAQWFGIILNSDSKTQLWVPPGFAHGFVVLSSEAIFSYKCDDYYQAEAEKSLLWNDPDLGIVWPVEAVSLSRKDEQARRLKEFKGEELPRY